jgi:hypothetical protein
MPPGLGGGVEADPGLVGQIGDPLGPQHRWEGAKHAWQAPGRHDRDTVHHDLAPGDLGTVDGHDRHHRQPRVGQDLGGLVGLDTAWSRSRTAHRGRWLGDQYWLASLGRPGRAGWPTRAAPAGRAAGQCVAPPPHPSARRRHRNWAETEAPSRLPRPPARRGAGPTAAPAGDRGLRRRHPPQGWRPPATAGCGSTPHSAARIRRHRPWAEPPGRPTLARTRTATTGRSATVPASSSSESSARWARMAWRSAWLSGRTEPLGRSSSSKGHG